MRLKSKSLNLKKQPRLSNVMILIAAVAYILLFTLAYRIFSDKNNLVGGQLSGNNAAAGVNLAKSLDLRIARKAAYPSETVTIVHDYGESSGLSTKSFSYKVADAGLTEYGLLVEPAGPPPKKGFPAIILCHGYESPTRYSTALTYLNDMQFYAQHGFAVFKPDYRGQGLSLYQGQPDSAYYSMAYNTDVMSLISALKKTAFIDRSNLNLWGHSMGAYIALRAAVLSADIKNLILLSGPVDSLSKMYLSYVPPSDVNNLNALKTRNDVFSKYGTPADDSNFWKFASPINMLGFIKAHIQIHVGELDQTVPPEFSADLAAALSAQHLKYEYYVYPDGPHSLEPQRQLIYSRSLQDLQPATPSSTT